MRMAKVLGVALMLAVLVGACGSDEPGTSPDTAVQFSLATPYHVTVGGVMSYYAYFRATTTSHTVSLTNQTRNFAVIHYGNDSFYGGNPAACDNQPAGVQEDCIVGTTGNYYYYFKVKNTEANAGSATVTIN
jgi:hypothetical protein